MAAQNNVLMIVGLGDDNKTYIWNPKGANWLPNWDNSALQAQRDKLELDRLRLEKLNKKPRITKPRKKAVKKKKK